MNPGGFRVSAWQVSVLAFALALCVSPLGVVRPLIGQLGRNAWTAVVPALCVAVWGVAVALALSRRWPGVPLDNAVVRVFGPYLGYPYVVSLAALFAIGAPVNLHVFTSSAHVTFLTHLPIAYAAVFTASAATYAAAFGPEVVARCAEVLAPGVAVALLTIFVAPLTNVHLGRLLPIGGAPWHAYLSGPVVMTTGLLRGFLPVLILAPFSRPLPKGMPFVAVGLAGLLLAVALGLPVAVFGTPFAETLANPFITAVGTVSWQWLPFQRLVVVVAVVWYAVAFIVFATYLWMAAWLTKRLFPALPWSGLLLTLGVGGTVAASLNLAGGLSDRIAQAWNVAVAILGVLVPTALLLASPRRRSTNVPDTSAGDTAWTGPAADGGRLTPYQSELEGAATE